MFKHLRGKHDQRDHGRQAGGGGGGGGGLGQLSQTARLLPPEVQARIAEGKPRTRESVNGIVSTISATLNLPQVSDFLKDAVESGKGQIEELTQRYDELQRSRKSPKRERELQEVQDKLVSTALFHESFREKYNDLLPVARAARLLPPEVQASMVERKTTFRETANLMVRNLSESWSTSQVADFMGEGARRKKEEVEELTRRHDEIQESPESGKRERDLREVQNKILNAVLSYEAFDEKYSDLLPVARSERKRET